MQRALAEGRITVHGWVYDGATGRIRAMSHDGVFDEVMGEVEQAPVRISA